MPVQIPPPPRLTGNSKDDFTVLLNFLWDLYKAIVTEAAFVQNGDIGTSVQAHDATLDALAGMTTLADALPYFTGIDQAAVANFTAYARTLLNDDTADDARSTLGLGALAVESIVSNALMAQMAATTIKGNDGVGAAAPQDLSVAEVKTMLGYTVQPVYFAPGTLSVVTGTHTSGVVGDLAAPGGSSVVVTEVNGTPGFDVQLAWTNVARPVGFVWRGNYNGSTSHVVDVYAWNYTTSAWNLFVTMQSETVTRHGSLIYPLNTDYVSGSSAQIRFVHGQAGVPGHTLTLDYCAVMGLNAV